MSHGTFAVPPPATARLVPGVPVYGEGEGELLTPTGALLVTAHATAYGPLPALRIEKAGHGAGGRETKGRPNVLRLIVGEEASAAAGERVLVLETEVDDAVAAAPRPAPRPAARGGRPRRVLHAGADEEGPARRPRDRDRRAVEARGPRGAALPRDDDARACGGRSGTAPSSSARRATVETAYGPIRVKIGRRGGVVYNAWPEFDDCQRAAGEKGVAVKEVLAAALAAWRDRAGKQA